jgi:hypothetical protein
MRFVWRGSGGGGMGVLGPGDLVCQAPRDEPTAGKGSFDDIAPYRSPDHRDPCIHLRILWYSHETSLS